LAGAEPDLSDEDVSNDDLLFASADDEPERFVAGGTCGHPGGPAPVAVGDRDRLHDTELDRDTLPSGRAPPDLDRKLLLKNHVILKNAGE
jgi:hypothetical protein